MDKNLPPRRGSRAPYPLYRGLIAEPSLAATGAASPADRPAGAVDELAEDRAARAVAGVAGFPGPALPIDSLSWAQLLSNVNRVMHRSHSPHRHRRDLGQLFAIVAVHLATEDDVP